MVEIKKTKFRYKTITAVNHIFISDSEVYVFCIPNYTLG